MSVDPGGGIAQWERTDGIPPTTPDTTAMPIVRFLTELRADMAWVRDAACAGAPDGKLWFPERGASARHAKAICAEEARRTQGQAPRVTKLHISEGLALPYDAVTEAIGWVGNRGSGKTYGAKVFAEELVGASAQVVVLDPVDAWWGLRHGAEKGTPGLGVYVFGGGHSDAGLEASAGGLLADVVVEQGISAVFSLRHLPKGRQRKFVADFLERLYLRKGEDQYRTPVHVVIEEAHTFAPQTMAREEDVARCLGAVQDVGLQGRSSGLGLSLLSQRVAMVAKSVLELVEILAAFRTTGPNARKALKGWFDAHDDTDERLAEFQAGITRLPRGEGYVWSPGYLDVFEQVRIREARTFDSSATPKPGARPARPAGAAADLDVEALDARIAETVERERENDPRTLKARVAELEAKLTAASQDRPAPEPVVERVEVPVLDEKVVAELVQALGAVEELGERLAGASDTAAQALGTAQASIDQAAARQAVVPAHQHLHHPGRAGHHHRRRPHRPRRMGSTPSARARARRLLDEPPARRQGRTRPPPGPRRRLPRHAGQGRRRRGCRLHARHRRVQQRPVPAAHSRADRGVRRPARRDRTHGGLT